MLNQNGTQEEEKNERRKITVDAEMLKKKNIEEHEHSRPHTEEKSKATFVIVLEFL